MFDYDLAPHSSFTSPVPQRRRGGISAVIVRLAARLSVIALLTVVGTVALQLVYPAGISTPMLRSNGAHVGARSQQAVTTKLSGRNQLSFSLKAEKQTYQLTYTEAGIEVDSERTAEGLMSYSLRERLVPFSIFRRSQPQTLAMRYDEAKLTSLASKIAKENIVQPVNATVKQTTNSYAVDVHSADGVTYEAEKVVATLKAVQPGTVGSLTIPATTTEPAVSTEDARRTIAQHNRQMHQDTYFVVGEKKFQISPKELKTFLAIHYDGKRNLLTSTHNKNAIRNYIKRIAKKVYIAPIAAKVRVHDGQTIAATDAKNGQMLNEGEAIKAMTTGLKETSSTITVKPQKISLNTIFARSYSKSNKGLQILIQDWQSDNGVSAGVVVRELTGQRRSASLNGSQSFLSASIAKLYLTHYLYNGIEKGSWTSNSKFGTSSTVGSCIQAMIVVSNNSCFHNIGNNRGWGNVTSFTWNKGFTSTNPNPAVYTTTAQDTAWYLQKLYTGSLVASSHRTQLLGHMRSQIHRNAIPAGSRGVVADKPGFWNGYWHDAGIVYHPKSTYILVVMTNGGTPSQIADLSRRISRFMDK